MMPAMRRTVQQSRCRRVVPLRRMGVLDCRPVRTSGIASMKPLQRLGFDATGQYRVHTHSWRELDGGQLVNLPRADLGQTVGQKASLILLAGHRPDVDDRSAAAARHVRHRVSAQLEGADTLKRNAFSRTDTVMSM